MRSVIITATALLVCAGLATAGTRADLTGDAVVDFQTTMDMPFMRVGNAGNEADTAIMNDGTTGYGAVGYAFKISKFEVTAGQYTEFLNAVAFTDTYGVYNNEVWANSQGCGIQQLGLPGSHTYAVAADWADRPVNFVRWDAAVRFVNWMSNGMPTGAQDATTTEDGSYLLNGATLREDLRTVTRKPDATYVLPSEDEWHKAACYDPVADAYYAYSTGTDASPSNDLIDPDSGNSANYYRGHFTIGSPYFRTEVGEFENSLSPYGTFDQTGNISEWTDTLLGSARTIRGGHYVVVTVNGAKTTVRWVGPMEYATRGEGFRVALVPEPATIGLLALGGLALLKRKK